MNFKDYCLSLRPTAQQSLVEVVQTLKKQPSSNIHLRDDLLKRFKTIIPKGKLTRFSLTQLGYSLFSSKISEDVSKVGIAIEFVHSGFLFHDDVMDKDLIRRGEDSLHVSYTKQYGNNPHLGESLAICAGDYSYFSAMNIVTALGLPDGIKTKCIELMSSEFSNVSLSQMQDVINSETQQEPTEEKIFSLYIGKTGRYSIGLPLVLGATIAGASERECNTLWSFSESVGILYQLKDDYLSLYGDSKVTGKPVGSDIAMNKKTLFRKWLLAGLQGKDREELLTLFGKKTISSKDLLYLKDMMKRTGALMKFEKMVSNLCVEAKKDIQLLNADLANKEILLDFVNYVTQRVS